MCDSVLEKLRNEYGDNFNQKNHTVKHRFEKNNTVFSIYYDRYDNNDNVYLMMRYANYDNNYYYLSPLSFKNGKISVQYLNDLDKMDVDLLGDLIDENYKLDGFFDWINSKILGSDNCIHASYSRDNDFTHSSKYRRDNCKDKYAPFLSYIRSGNIKPHRSYLKDKFNIDDKILDAFEEYNFNIIGTIYSYKRKRLKEIVNMLESKK